MDRIQDFRIGDKSSFTRKISFECVEKIAEILGNANLVYIYEIYADPTILKIELFM